MTDRQLVNLVSIESEIEVPDYWQGVGTAYTKADYVDTGTGTSEREALEDALERIAMRGYRLDDETEDRLLSEASTENIPCECGADEDDGKDCECEALWYVSILYAEIDPEDGAEEEKE